MGDWIVKQDLIDEGHSYTIPSEDIDEFVAKHKLRGFIKVSSKTGFNVKESFGQVSEMMIERNISGGR